MAEVAEGEVAQPMVAPGGRRGRKLEVRGATITGKKMRLTLQISGRRNLERLPMWIGCILRELVHRL
jgi:hypothetical protein